MRLKSMFKEAFGAVEETKVPLQLIIGLQSAKLMEKILKAGSAPATAQIVGMASAAELVRVSSARSLGKMRGRRIQTSTKE